MMRLLPGEAVETFVSYFGIPVSEFPLTHRDGLTDEVSDVGRKAAKRLVGFTHHCSLYGMPSYYTAFHMTITRSLSLWCATDTYFLQRALLT
jgi:hypothetical protein